MAGNREGGMKAAATNKRKYGEDFYRQIGTIGGRNSKGGAFGTIPGLAQSAGAKGGRASRRKKAEV